MKRGMNIKSYTTKKKLVLFSIFFLMILPIIVHGECSSDSFEKPGSVTADYTGTNADMRNTNLQPGIYYYTGKVTLGNTIVIGSVTLYATEIEVLGNVDGTGNGFSKGKGECVSKSLDGQNGDGPLRDENGITKGGGGEGGCHSESGGGGGASYGGLGGGPSRGAVCNGLYETEIYGNLNDFDTVPSNGSGGGGGNSYLDKTAYPKDDHGDCCADGGNGGGGLALIASNKLTIFPPSNIIMNGNDGEDVKRRCVHSAGAGGGGSGGEIILAGKNLNIDPAVNLMTKGGNGGNGNGDPAGDEGGSGGGGGRIKVFYSSNLGTAVPSANTQGGDGGEPQGRSGLPGDIGSIYILPCGPSCIPSPPEICNNKDDDCNGFVDEGLGTTTCGVGLCEKTIQNCVNGIIQSCDPYLPEQETCNEVDDDCDGLIDDENTCCGFNNAYWEVPIDCRDKSIGAGANVSLITEADDECSFDYDTIGIYTVSTSTFRLKNTNTNKNVDITVSFGQTGDKPIAGDWDGDGIDTIGVYRPINSMVYLSNKNYNPISDLSFNFIPSSDIALAGDWDGDGKDSIGLYKSQFSTFRLRNSNTEDGSADIIVSFGQSGDVPVVGDWDNNSIDTIGVYRPSTRTFFLKNLNTAGAANLIVSFGQTGDKPIAGDWDGDGIDTIGVYRPSTKRVFLKNSNTAGAEDLSFSINAEGDTPLSGDFDANKKNRAYIKLQVKEDDMVSYDDLSSKDPAPSTGWFGYNGKLNASWIAEYQEDESGTNPEYYFNANFLAASSEKSIKSEEIPFIKVKPCDRTKDGDCDSVDDEDDACLDTKECKEVYPNGCETPEQSECVALWDCSNVPWGDCIANQQSRGIGDCSTYANLQSGNCNCGFTGDDDDFNQCSQVFMPATEKTCLEEEAFPAFTFLNMIITILILTSFYILKKKY